MLFIYAFMLSFGARMLLRNLNLLLMAVITLALLRMLTDRANRRPTHLRRKQRHAGQRQRDDIHTLPHHPICTVRPRLMRSPPPPFPPRPASHRSLLRRRTSGEISEQPNMRDHRKRADSSSSHDVVMSDSASDIEMSPRSPEDTPVDPAPKPSKYGPRPSPSFGENTATGNVSTPQAGRIASEKRAHMEAVRQDRADALVALAAAWGQLDSQPDATSWLLKRESFSPRFYALLANGRRFLDLARPIGRIASSKKMQNQYRRQGRAFNAGQGDSLGAIIAYNERVLAYTPPQTHPRRSRRSSSPWPIDFRHGHRNIFVRFASRFPHPSMGARNWLPLSLRLKDFVGCQNPPRRRYISDALAWTCATVFLSVV